MPVPTWLWCVYVGLQQLLRLLNQGDLPDGEQKQQQQQQQQRAMAQEDEEEEEEPG